MSSDAFTYCGVCRVNHTLHRKHIFTKKHKQKLKIILQKYGQKIKECRPYLNDPVIQEGNYEPDGMFWCHCCAASFKKHVSDFLKTILYGGVIEHLASEGHWTNTEKFWSENGADLKFKISFIISQTDLNLFKSKLEPLVDVFESRKNKKTKEIASLIESQQIYRNISLGGGSMNSTGKGESSKTNMSPIFKTVKNQFGIVQNPSGYHDNVRVWKGGIVKYKPNSDQICPFLFTYNKLCKKTANIKRAYTVSADSSGLSTISLKFDPKKGNIHTGAIPPWLQVEKEHTDSEIPEKKEYGPSEDDLKKHLKGKEKKKLNPNRVGANFDHTLDIENEIDWLPSFGRVWKQGARWKSRHEYRNEVSTTSKKKFKKI